MADFQKIQQSAKAAGGSGQNTDVQNSDQALGKINREFEERAAMQRAKELKLPYIDVASFPVNPDILHVITPAEAKRSLVMPFFKTGNRLRLAVLDPNNSGTKKIIEKLEANKYEVQVNVASAAAIAQALRLYASDQYRAKEDIKNIVKDEEIHYEKELKSLMEVKDKIPALPAEEALNTLNVSAIRAGASDIHYQPEETACTVRFRIDGVLHTVFELMPEVYARLAGQIKYKAKMKLNVTNEPQDGRFKFLVNERKIDVRVSSLPTEFGESFVCRILDSGRRFMSFEELGFTGKSLEILERSADLAQGMVLVTGPTSSGKTTSLYVLLNRFNKPEEKIITLEDPIEYHVEGVTQSQVNEKRGYNFASGLRSILRQDPDVVMVGEIRDLETAEVCTQAALTGHVLLSTLHTKGAVDTIPRLMTIGVPAFMISPALSLIVAQRLVRKLCSCAKDRAVSAKEKALIEKTLNDIKVVDPSVKAEIPAKLKVANGCEKCNKTGFRGQLVISEAFEVDDDIKEAILKNVSAPEIFALVRKKGMVTLWEDGVLKVIAGQTTLDEVHRVTNA